MVLCLFYLFVLGWKVNNFEIILKTNTTNIYNLKQHFDDFETKITFTHKKMYIPTL